MSPVAPEGWRAGLELGFAATGSGKTLLARRRHHGPLAVQRPFHPEGGVCHVYLLHPPGGVVGGDRLSIRVGVDPGAAALLTTPAAGKFYRSAGPWARQAVALDVGPGAALEWLPQETIVYQGARLSSETRVDLREGARFLGWEVLTLGRPAAGEGFEAGEAGLDWRIDLEGRPLYWERLVLDPVAFRANWGLRGRPALGTLFAYPATAAQLDTVRGLVGDSPDLGVSLIEGLLVCRGLDARADLLRRFFERVWAALRPGVMDRPACPPRIWAT